MLQKMFVAHSRDDGIYQSLDEHLNQTASVAEGFARPFGAGDWARAIGLYHDFGKSSEAVQARIHGDPRRADHSTAGAQAVRPFTGLIGAYCIAGHHGALPDGGARGAAMESDGTLHGRLLKNLPPNERPNPGFAPAPASRPRAFPSDHMNSDGMALALFIRMLSSCLVDADRLDTELYANHGQTARGGYSGMPELCERLVSHLAQFGSPARPIDERRASILSACTEAAEGERGLYSLTVPTGGGKTLSSLAFALRHAMLHRCSRVIYVIPYTNIIEQTADVFRKALGAENVLEHHSGVSWPDAESDDCDASSTRLKLSTENWDAPVIVTTNVQFFESLYAARASKLRKLHHIADSVLIFDEAQMLPLSFLLPCVDAIAELVRDYRCTAVLMSATQPALEPYFPPEMPTREIMKDPGELYRFFRRTTIRQMGAIDMDTLAGCLSGHQRALCIVNTRKRAQQLYRALEGREGLFHLSTLMYPDHRRGVLAEIRARLDPKNPRPCLVIATSLVEAGVDLDFPAVYREQAGLDSVIQAAGRCNREGRFPADQSTVWVFRVADDGGAPASMLQSIAGLNFAMERSEDIGSLEAIHDYFSFIYKLRGEALDQKRIRALTCQNMRELSIPFRQIEERFQLIESGTRPVVIATVDEAARILRQIETEGASRALMRRLNAFTVNIYPDHARELLAVGALSSFGEDGYLLVDANQYDACFGLALEPKSGLALIH